jgi:hypothetical protein
MILAIHVPMFGTAHTDARSLICACGANDWDWRGDPVAQLVPGQPLTCLRCGKISKVMWGTEEPDHVSTWINGEYCPHYLCKSLAAKLRQQKGYVQERRNL